MNYDEQILELKKRIEFLEKAENKRIMKKKRDFAFKIGKFILIVILLFLGYINFIKPYKEKIDYFEQKINSVEEFINEKLDVLGDYNSFFDFDL